MNRIVLSKPSELRKAQDPWPQIFWAGELQKVMPCAF